MQNTGNKKQAAVKTEPKRLVDIYFDKYAESHQNGTNKTIHWICVPLIVFSLLGLVSSIPFPHLAFLGQYAGYINWGLLLIAFSIYFYSTLSPTLAFIMLLVVLLFTYLIYELTVWHLAGGPALWLVCLVIFVASWIGQFIGHKIEGKKPSFLDDIKFLLIGPIWLIHFILKKYSIRY